jgi:hypothetical protein
MAYGNYGQKGYQKDQRESIVKPRIGEYQGNPTISIPFGKDGQPFTFGYTKAKAILNWIDDIALFVKEIEQKRVEAGKDAGRS